MELTMAKANQVKTAVIASLDAKYKTATVTVKRIKRIIRKDPKTVALGVLTGTVLAGVVTGVTAIAIYAPNQPKTDFSEMVAVTTTTSVTTYAPEVNNEVEEAVTTVKATTTAKTTEAKEEVTTTKAVTTTAPVQEEPEVATTSGPAVVIPDEVPIDFARHEDVTEAQEEEPEAEYVDYDYDNVEASLNAILSSEDKYLLCNVLGREYGSDFVPVAEKAHMVAAVMNRVYNDGNHPEFDSVNTVAEVLSQPGQFPGWLPNNEYTYRVTDSVKEAVLYYFNNSNSETYKYDYYYYGDGTWNYFRYYY